MTQYVNIRLTLKQAKAGDAALVNAYDRVFAEWADPAETHGFQWELLALFRLREALITAINSDSKER